jgi:antitoxin (DNA-binding transcriptional repressor) of toxin-antitoxin stability system
MKTVSWTDNTAWEEAIREAEGEEVLVMRGGHAVALLVPFDDDDLQWYAQERDPEFVASLAEARRQVQEGRAISHGLLKSELGLT